MPIYSACTARILSVRVAPFGNPRILRLFTAPRGFSQLATSFFGSQWQGIPLALFLAWPFLQSFSLCIMWSSLFVLNSSIFLWIVVFLLPYFLTCMTFQDGCHTRLSLVCLFFVQFSRCVVQDQILNSDKYLIYLNSNFNLKFCNFSCYKIFSSKKFGGLKWNRTIDLTLIRRAL